MARVDVGIWSYTGYVITFNYSSVTVGLEQAFLATVEGCNWPAISFLFAPAETRGKSAA